MTEQKTNYERQPSIWPAIADGDLIERSTYGRFARRKTEKQVSSFSMMARHDRVCARTTFRAAAASQVKCRPRETYKYNTRRSIKRVRTTSSRQLIILLIDIQFPYKSKSRWHGTISSAGHPVIRSDVLSSFYYFGQGRIFFFLL